MCVFVLLALEYQVGNEVLHNEIAQLIGPNNETVSCLIDLLVESKSFFIRVGSGFTCVMKSKPTVNITFTTMGFAMR